MGGQIILSCTAIFQHVVEVVQSLPFLITCLGVGTILSTCTLLRATSVIIFFELIFWIGFKLSRNRPSGNVSRTLVTKSYPMMTVLKKTGIRLDHFAILECLQRLGLNTSTLTLGK